MAKTANPTVKRFTQYRDVLTERGANRPDNSGDFHFAETAKRKTEPHVEVEQIQDESNLVRQD